MVSKLRKICDSCDAYVSVYLWKMSDAKKLAELSIFNAST
jgi:hypothetical protein